VVGDVVGHRAVQDPGRRSAQIMRTHAPQTRRPQIRVPNGEAVDQLSSTGLPGTVDGACDADHLPLSVATDGMR
jgi:hypothetical protein